MIPIDEFDANTEKRALIEIAQLRITSLELHEQIGHGCFLRQRQYKHGSIDDLLQPRIKFCAYFYHAINSFFKTPMQERLR